MVQVLRNVCRPTERSPWCANTQRRVDGVTGHGFLEFVVDRQLSILIPSRTDRVLNRQASSGRFAIGKEIELKRRESTDGSIGVGEAGVVDRRASPVRPLRSQAFHDKAAQIPTVRVALDRDVVGNLK